MLDQTIVETVVREAVASTFKAVPFERVLVEPTVDSEGKDALRVLVVLGERGADDIDGDLALDTLVGIDRKLQSLGDDRLAIVSFSTVAELSSADADL